MNVTAECINATPVEYGYFPVKTLNLYLPSLQYTLYQGIPDYLGSKASMYLDIDFPDLMNYDAIVFTTPPRMNLYVGSMFPTSAFTFLLVAQTYQIPVITYPVHQSNTFFYTANTQSTQFSTTTKFSEVVNELGLTEDSSILLVHPENEYDDTFSVAKPEEAIKFFKEYQWK